MDTMTPELTTLVELFNATSGWAIFLYLYLSEKKMHEITRIAYRNDLREMAELRRD